MSIALQVFVNLSKLLEGQGAKACDAECVRWMVGLVKQNRPALLDVSDPGNAHTMAVSIYALDLAAGQLPNSDAGRRQRAEINGAMTQAIGDIEEKHMAAGLSDTEINLVKRARERLGGGRGMHIQQACSEDPAAGGAGRGGGSGIIPASPWRAVAGMDREADAVRELRAGQGIEGETLVRLALPAKNDIRTENLDSSVQAIISEKNEGDGVDWVGLALVCLALVAPPVGLFMSGAAWAMEHKGRSMVLAALSVAGSMAWIMTA